MKIDVKNIYYSKGLGSNSDKYGKRLMVNLNDNLVSFEYGDKVHTKFAEKEDRIMLLNVFTAGKE